MLGAPDSWFYDPPYINKVSLNFLFCLGDVLEVRWSEAAAAGRGRDGPREGQAHGAPEGADSLGIENRPRRPLASQPLRNSKNCLDMHHQIQNLISLV